MTRGLLLLVLMASACGPPKPKCLEYRYAPSGKQCIFYSRQ